MADITIQAIQDVQLTKADKTSFTAKRNTENKKCWRLVHDGKKVLNLFESDGYTMTKYNLVCGSYENCMKVIKANGLTMPPEESTDEQIIQEVSR